MLENKQELQKLEAAENDAAEKVSRILKPVYSRRTEVWNSLALAAGANVAAFLLTDVSSDNNLMQRFYGYRPGSALTFSVQIDFVPAKFAKGSADVEATIQELVKGGLAEAELRKLAGRDPMNYFGMSAVLTTDQVIALSWLAPDIIKLIYEAGRPDSDND